MAHSQNDFISFKAAADSESLLSQKSPEPSTIHNESVDYSRPLFDKRPGAISNVALIEVHQDREGLTLKEGLIEHHDYEAVLPKVWEYLVSWYDLKDREGILRPVRFDKKR